jgi:hypothetical protein
MHQIAVLKAKQAPMLSLQACTPVDVYNSPEINAMKE